MRGTYFEQLGLCDRVLSIRVMDAFCLCLILLSHCVALSNCSSFWGQSTVEKEEEGEWWLRWWQGAEVFLSFATVQESATLRPHANRLWEQPRNPVSIVTMTTFSTGSRLQTARSEGSGSANNRSPQRATVSKKHWMMRSPCRRTSRATRTPWPAAGPH